MISIIAKLIFNKVNKRDRDANVENESKFKYKSHTIAV